MMEMWMWPCQNQINVVLNENPYFLLHILVAYLESFPIHYNKVTFHWVFSKLWNLKVTELPALSMYARVSEILTRARLRDLSTLLDIRSRARNWIQSFLIVRFNFPLFFVQLFFQFFYISGLFQSFY